MGDSRAGLEKTNIFKIMSDIGCLVGLMKYAFVI